MIVEAVGVEEIVAALVVVDAVVVAEEEVDAVSAV